MILGMLNTVRSVIPAGAAIPPDCEAKLRRNFPNLDAVASVYGTSEIGIVARWKANNKQDLGPML
jgi:hypothetical protein